MPLATRRPLIQICDDQIDVREALRLLLKGQGYAVETFGSPEELLAAARQSLADVILLDMNYTRDTTSGEEGLSLIRQLRQARVPAPLLAMTAWGDISLAVSAMQSGASDFLEKPWNNERLLQIVAKWVAARQSVHLEMDRAQETQLGLLPKGHVTGQAFQAACRFLPAREVSGDYYDFLSLGDGREAFLVADVSGKGVGAALLMANLQALFRSHAPASDPLALLEKVNALFHASTPPAAFATLFLGIVEAGAGCLQYINSGHPSGLLQRPQGVIDELPAASMLLGAFPFWQGELGETEFRPGDRLLVSSDGAAEAQSSGEEFGEERLRAILTRTAGQGPNETLDALERAILHHSGAALFDDCTLLLVEPAP